MDGEQLQPFVSVDAARAKLIDLHACGIGHQQAAKLAGIAKSTAQRIRVGKVLLISRDVETAILSIQKPYLARGTYVKAWHLKRWLRALLDERFTKKEIAERAGLDPDVLYRENEHIRVETHLKIQRFWRSVSAD